MRVFKPRRRGLGDVPADLRLGQRNEPPILNMRPTHELDNAPPDQWHGQDLVNFRAVVGTTSEIVVPYNPARCYILLVNTSVTEIRLGINHGADLITGLPLPAGGGFYEPVLGTRSQIFAISTVAARDMIVVEGFYSESGIIKEILGSLKTLVSLRGG